MIPNDFGIIRQKDHNLFALLFPTLTDISEYYIEVLYVDPELWNINKAITSASGEVTTRAGMKYATVNVNKYDYVMVPSSVDRSVSSGVYNGTVTSSSTNPSSRIFIRAANNNISAYSLIKIGLEKFILTNQLINDNMPIIGFIRHRSDNVNPKGLIKDVNSDILQPVKEDELNGEADRIRDELPSNAESPDLDSKSGAGADERADS